MIGRVFAAAMVVSVGFLQPAHASSHCNMVDDAFQRAYSVLSVNTGDVDPEVCEAELDVARGLLDTALTGAKACGCTSLEAGVAVLIEQSRSPDYACWNRRQGVRTSLGNGIVDYGC